MMAVASLEGNDTKMLAVRVCGAMTCHSGDLIEPRTRCYEHDGCHRILTQHCVSRKIRLQFYYQTSSSRFSSLGIDWGLEREQMERHEKPESEM